MDIVAKTIPATRRGSLLWRRLFAGSVLGLLASVMVGVILSEQNPSRFPTNVGDACSPVVGRRRDRSGCVCVW